MDFEVGNVYNIDFTTSGGYRLFLKFLTYDGEYISGDFTETLHMFWTEGKKDLISISAKKIVNVILERRALP